MLSKDDWNIAGLEHYGDFASALNDVTTIQTCMKPTMPYSLKMLGVWSLANLGHCGDFASTMTDVTTMQTL